MKRKKFEARFLLGDNLLKEEGIKKDETPKPLSWLAVFKWYSSYFIV